MSNYDDVFAPKGPQPAPKRPAAPPQGDPSIVVNMGCLIIVLIGMFATCCSSCGTVGTGEVGVPIRFGRITGSVYTEGLYMKAPFVERVHEMNIQLQRKDIDDIPSRSKDNVALKVDVTLQYSLNGKRAPQVFRRLGEDYLERVLVPALNSAVRDAVAELDALTVAQSRDSLETSIRARVRAAVRETLGNHQVARDALAVDNVQLRMVDLPASLTASIEAIQRQQNKTRENQMAIDTARQEAEKARVEVEGRNRATLLEAQGRAAVALAQAEGEARARDVRGTSEAEYYRRVGNSLNRNVIERERVAMQGQILANGNTRLVVLGAPESSPMVWNPNALMGGAQ